MSTLEEFIPMTRGGAEVAAFTGQPAPRGCYNRLKNRAYDGAIPAVMLEGRLGFYRKDLPTVCAALGLISSAAPSPPESEPAKTSAAS